MATEARRHRERRGLDRQRHELRQRQKQNSPQRRGVRRGIKGDDTSNGDGMSYGDGKGARLQSEAAATQANLQMTGRQNSSNVCASEQITGCEGTIF
jgi:hypothetical protein